MAELAERQTEHNRVAVVMDIREPRFVSDFPRVYRKLRTNKHLSSRLIFLEAGEAELVRRFSVSRRPHPLAPDRPVTEGLSEERKSLRQIRAMADKVIDTSKLNVHELRQQLRELVSGHKQASKLVLTILSFGFQNGPPAEADLMFDVRFLKNPHWVPSLRPLTGKDPAVAAYIRRQPTARHRHQETLLAAALDGAALRPGREELLDDCGWLHRRQASIGLRRRGAEARARRPQGRLGTSGRIATW